MKAFKCVNTVCLWFLLVSMTGCIPELDREEPSVIPIDPEPKGSQSVDKIRIDSHVLSAIKEQIADHPPMRGGNLFGVIKNGEADIQYFLYDYAASPGAGSYGPGENANQNIAIALQYEDEPKKRAASSYLGHVHSKPGSMNYVLAQNEAVIEKYFSRHEKEQNYIIPIVTMGSSTMQKIEPHEMKLSDNAKISFFVKERGKPTKAIRVLRKYDGNPESYKKMHSFVSARAHIADAIESLGLTKLGQKTVLSSLKDDWLFFLNFPQKIVVVATFDRSYPMTPPTLICGRTDANDKIISKIAEEQAKNWQPNDKNPKNFEEFIERFIRDKCPLNK